MLLIIKRGEKQNASCIFIFIGVDEHNQFVSMQHHFLPNTTYFKLKLFQLHKYRIEAHRTQNTCFSFFPSFFFKSLTYLITV